MFINEVGYCDIIIGGDFCKICNFGCCQVFFNSYDLIILNEDVVVLQDSGGFVVDDGGILNEDVV